MKPHKWANEIKAWADGAVIEFRSIELTNGEWLLLHRPNWYEDVEYRVQPLNKKYRVFLSKTGYTSTIDSWDEHSTVENVEKSDIFVKWLSDWVEYN